MKKWTIAAGESPRVYLINDGPDAVGEIVYTDTRRPEDARLIAAAPDLLAALDDLLSYLEGYDHDYPEAAGYFDRARTALAKAEGVKA